ncbi:short-chain dehydrogenase/reductase SDR [Tolypothrix tenuis PCC 7101]|uniref:Short-chain dehydrogenase/reductase SDR n=1 Tax=Tolypothrix tenuis PCC 7101 TaxID=231146 RepID=A0A1Z4N0S8_9CYAN|nr:SDR family oxidoreductase [Aulosira sp. FACHB-113]BAY99300.1 short-chain dehydrogenase/reductase SDR [Tolypothrix tenuis PCC 7101]BAZ76777.1 short-chain dehydrogenase/reductase SDR [Aulosira laxa NIES-50]
MISKLAIVTGGTRGIGWGISQHLAKDGYDLILGFNSNEEAASIAKAKLELNYGCKVSLIKGDVAEESTIEKIFQCVEDDFGGKLTALIHNAGLYVGTTTSSQSQRAILATNDSTRLLGTGKWNSFDKYDYYQNVYPKCLIRCVEKAINYMEDKNGYIVAISSPGCNNTQTPRLDYVMPGQAKAVVEFLVRNYAKALAPRQITVNVVIPGFVKTDAWEFATANRGGVDGDAMKNRIENTPMQRWASVEEIGAAVAFLCSVQAAFITGVALPVDGGLHLS